MSAADLWSRLGTIEGKLDLMLTMQQEDKLKQREERELRNVLEKRVSALETAWAKATGVIALVALALPEAVKHLIRLLST
jgi:hypothetical protein